VTDEWGAVVQHQADVERRVEEDEKRLYKERQKRYKEDLDKQYHEAMTQRTKRSGGKTLEGVGLQLYKEDREKELQDRRQAARVELLREMHERQECLVVEKSKEMAEKSEYEQCMKLLEENDTKKKMEERERKQQLASALRVSYGEQELKKRQSCLTEREIDKKLMEQERMNWPIIDYEKQRFRSILEKSEKVDRARQGVYEVAVKAPIMNGEKKIAEFVEKRQQDKERKDLEHEIFEKERRLQVLSGMNYILGQGVYEADT